ncbi:hypothetical protein G3M48_004413 [Beauveria asiatica]|uniref:2EXR domain-containing protein n=1 Tax=Beauveria asiatica TaxID=1069075 RepID=A0AAW0S7B3_9HYPO
MDTTEQAASPKWSSLPAEIQTMIWRWAVRPTHLTLLCAFDQGMLENDDITWEELEEWTQRCDHMFLGKKIARAFGCAKRDGRPFAYFLASPPPVYRVCRESCALLRKHFALNPATPRGTTMTTTTTIPPPPPPSLLEAALPSWFSLRDDVVQLLYHDIDGILTPSAPLCGLLRPVRHLRVAMHRSLWQRAWGTRLSDTVVSSERLVRVARRIRLAMPNLLDVTFVVAGRGPDPFWASRTAVHVAHWCQVFEQWCLGGDGEVRRTGTLPLQVAPAAETRVVARHEDGTEEEWLTRDNFLAVLQRQLKREMPVPGPDGLDGLDGPGLQEMMEQQAMLESYYPKYRDILRATEQELANPAAFLKAHQELWHGPNVRLPF